MRPGAWVRIGVLGASQAAVEAVIEPAKRLGHELVLVGSRSRERGQAFARAHGIPEAVEGYRDVIERDDLDLVYVGLVNSAHAQWAAMAVQRGRHALVEKPFTVDLAQAKAVVAAAQASHRHVFDGYHYAHHPLFARVIDVIASGEIGHVTAIDARLAMVRPAPTSSRWSFDLGGGSLLDLGCYGLDACDRLAEALGGGATVTTAQARPSSKDARVDARMDVRLQLPGGAEGRVRCGIDGSVWSMAARDTWLRLRSPEVATRGMVMRLEVVGESGSMTVGNFVLPQLDDRIMVRSRAGTRIERLGRVRSYDWQLMHIAEVLGFEGASADALRDRPGLHRDPLRTMALLDEAFSAAGLPARPSPPARDG